MSKIEEAFIDYVLGLEHNVIWHGAELATFKAGAKWMAEQVKDTVKDAATHEETSDDIKLWKLAQEVLNG